MLCGNTHIYTYTHNMGHTHTHTRKTATNCEVYPNAKPFCRINRILSANHQTSLITTIRAFENMTSDINTLADWLANWLSPPPHSPATMFSQTFLIFHPSTGVALYVSTTLWGVPAQINRVPDRSASFVSVFLIVRYTYGLGADSVCRPNVY